MEAGTNLGISKILVSFMLSSRYSLFAVVQVDIYNINILEKHKASQLKEPHIFGVASSAFRFG
jgi:hypothetical protein